MRSIDEACTRSQRLNFARIQRLIALTRLFKSAAYRREEYANRHAKWLDGRRAGSACGSHPAHAVACGTCSKGWLRTSRIPEHRRVEQRLSLRSLWCSRAGLGSGSVAAKALGVSRLVRTVGCGSGCCPHFWSRNHEIPEQRRVRPRLPFLSPWCSQGALESGF